MKRLIVFTLIGVAGCSSGWRAQGSADWKQAAVDEGERLVRQQLAEPSLRFSHLAVTGDNKTGQACGYYRKAGSVGGRDRRFIYFIDGANGQNPYLEDPAAPYPENKDDFEANWKDQCLGLGYKG